MRTNDIPDEIKNAMLSGHPVGGLISRANGQILWSNREFQQQVGYTAEELTAAGMSWIVLSVPGPDLDADLRQLQSLTDTESAYAVRKQLRPKSAAPIWGTMSINRVLVGGEPLFWCTWEPMRDNTGPAFLAAIEHIQQTAEEIRKMNHVVTAVTARDSDEEWIISTFRAARRHPHLMKIVLAGVLATGSSLSLNAIIEFGQRIGVISPPSEIKKADEAAGVPLLADPIDVYKYARTE